MNEPAPNAKRGKPVYQGGSGMGVDIAEIRMTLKDLTQRLNTIGGHL